MTSSAFQSTTFLSYTGKLDCTRVLAREIPREIAREGPLDIYARDTARLTGDATADGALDPCYTQF